MSDTVAIFYSPTQQRAKGKFADEGRAYVPHPRQPKPKQHLVDRSADLVEQPGYYDRAGVDVDSPEHDQLVSVAMTGKVSMYDTAGVKRLAQQEGYKELEAYITKLDADPDGDAKWFHDLVLMGDEMGAAQGAKETPRSVEANLGVTPYRGKPGTDVESTTGYYGSNRYKAWLTDLRVESHRLHVIIHDVVKSTGVWHGKAEPSASVWVNGSESDVEDLAKSLGSEYNQEGVMLFQTPKEGTNDSKSALYTLPGVADVSKAVVALGKYGIDGGRVIHGTGEHSLEVIDMDGSMYDRITGLAKELGTQILGTPGEARLLSGGQDYQRRTRPHKGRGITHANEGVMQYEDKPADSPYNWSTKKV